MKTWDFLKGACNCTLVIYIDEYGWLRTDVYIENKKIQNCVVSEGLLYFDHERYLNFKNGYDWYQGLSLMDLGIKEEVEEYYNQLKHKENKKHTGDMDKELKALWEGKKKFITFYHQGKQHEGYVICGVGKTLVKKLGCSNIQEGDFCYIDKEFEDLNIEKMKDSLRNKSPEEYNKLDIWINKKEGEEELKKISKDLNATWIIKKYYETDVDGKKRCYKHFITINDKTYIFYERYIVGMGTVINPAYSVADGIEGGLASTENGKKVWKDYIEGKWVKVRDMEEDEGYAYQIIQQYTKR